MRGQIVWKMRRYKYPTINTDTYTLNEDWKRGREYWEDRTEGERRGKEGIMDQMRGLEKERKGGGEWGEEEERR